MQELPDALKPLASYRQFVVQQLIRNGDGTITKHPIDAHSLRKINAHSPDNWLTLDQALTFSNACGLETTLGFVITDNDPFFFVDIDHCLQADNTWSPFSQEIVQKFPGAAVEVSVTGDGLHIIGCGTSPEHRCKNTSLGLEYYTEKRIITIAGNQCTGNAATDFTYMLGDFVAGYMPPPQNVNDNEWTTEAVAGKNIIADDDELIERAKNSFSASGALGYGATFKDLWEKNVDVLNRRFAKADGTYDASSADFALCTHLAFWTGNDCERIHNLMLQSGLVRDKWNWHTNYLTDTILNVKRIQTNFYTGRDIPEGPGESEFTEDGLEITSGFQFMSITQQLEHFKNCYYIISLNRILTPNGALLDQQKFKAAYGGYDFALDNQNAKTTKNAWEIFTESQAIRFKKVDSMIFKPDLKPGEIVEQEGLTLVNSYRPIEVPSTEGDPSPFIEHLFKILPNERDRDILINYMAAIVQHKGVKFKWCPVLQGVEGNGKTLFSECVAHAVGMRYSHFPKANKIDSQFNGWLINKIFIGVEDIYVPDHRREVVESLKPMITGKYQEVESKGVDQVTIEVCANFILNSNHRDGIRKTKNDRRFCMLFTAQQEEEHLKRDGLTGAYFTKLYDWLNNGGFAVVTNYL